MKVFSTKLSFCNLTQQIVPANRTMYFSQLLKANLLSEAIVSQVQLAFISLNATIITVEHSEYI